MTRERRPVLDLAERRELRRWVRQSGSDPRRARRARIVLELAAGRTVGEVALRVGVHPETVVRWRRRFAVHRLEGLVRDAPRVHARGPEVPNVEYRILRTTWEPPPAGSPRWTTRSLGRALRVNHMRVHRVWKSHGILVPTTDEPIALARSQAPPEVLGVFLESPSAVAIRVPGIEEEWEDQELALPDPIPPVGDAARSGGYHLGVGVRSSLGLLSALDRAYSHRAPASPDPKWTSPELLVFLRSVAERSQSAGDVHVFFDRPLPLGVPRFEAWRATNPGVRLHDPDPGEAWTVSIDRWLRSGPLRAALDDRLRISSTFDAALGRAFDATQGGGPRRGRAPKAARGTGA